MPAAKLTYSDPNDPRLKQLLIKSIELATGRMTLEKRYNEILDADPAPEDIWGIALNKLALRLDFDDNQLNKIPKSGPIIFIANHLFGVVDGLAMGYLVSLLHKRFKFLVNAVLCRDEKLNQFLLPVDFAPSKAAQKTNIETRAKAMDCLAKDIPIVIFPSGGVATAPKFWKKAEDLEWKLFVIKLIRKSKATVIPIYFHGQNSRLFQVVSQFSLDLRLALLLNEVRNKMGKSITVNIGDPITYEDMELYQDKSALLRFLRSRVFSLKR
ncbi:MAG: lysophospholipid acyltransferase family protein [Bacteroidota bacterium]